MNLDARVALVMPSLQIGGAERLLVDMVATWRGEGGPENIYVYAFEDGPAREEFTDLGCRVQLSPLHGAGAVAIPWLVRRFRTDRIQLVHANLPRAGVYARVAATTLRLPVLYTEHNIWEVHRLPVRLLNRLTYRLNDYVVAVSEAVRSTIALNTHYPSKRLTCIPNGIRFSASYRGGRSQIRRRLKLAEDAPVIGTIANLAPRKGLQFLVHAVEELAVDLPDLRCLMIGRDSGEGRLLRDLAEARKVVDKIVWLGYRSDARTLLPALDVFVLSSLAEGLPIALLEAMAIGLPVAVTDVGGNREVVDDGRCGMLVPPANSSHLASAIRTLLEDPAQRVELGDAAAERVATHYSIRATAAHYARLYSSLSQATDREVPR